jgi:hypothetical protein
MLMLMAIRILLFQVIHAHAHGMVAITRYSDIIGPFWTALTVFGQQKRLLAAIKDLSVASYQLILRPTAAPQIFDREHYMLQFLHNLAGRWHHRVRCGEHPMETVCFL